MTNPQATTTVSKLDFALVEVSQSKTPIYSDKTAFCEKQNGVLTLTKRRSIRNKMKSLKINYLQGCKLLLFGVWKQHKKRGETRKFRPLIEEILFINCLLNNQFLCVY